MSTALWTKQWALDHGLKLQFDRETSSTNAVAKDDASAITKPALTTGAVSAPTLYLAETQTAGRGRGQNLWASAPGALLSTWSFAVSFPPQPILSPLIGLALYESATISFPGVLFNLKAPNDLYIGEKKVAGLLIETVLIGESVTCAIGLGFNVLNIPSELSESATSLVSNMSGELNQTGWNKFLNTWLEKLSQAVKDSRSDMLRMEVRIRLVSALNLHPLLKDPVLTIDEFGQLLTPKGRIFWHQL